MPAKSRYLYREEGKTWREDEEEQEEEREEQGKQENRCPRSPASRSSFRPRCQAVSEEVLEMIPPRSHLTATA